MSRFFVAALAVSVLFVAACSASAEDPKGHRDRTTYVTAGSKAAMGAKKASDGDAKNTKQVAEKGAHKASASAEPAAPPPDNPVPPYPPGLEPSVIAKDQRGGPMLVIKRIVTPVPAWVLIRLYTDGGKPGSLIGYAYVEPGVSENVSVDIREAWLTRRVWVVMHVDDGLIGEFEYPQGQGDPPMIVGGKPLMTEFGLK